MTTVNVILTNRTATLMPPVDPAALERLRQFWSFSPKGLWFMPRYQPTKIAKGQREEAIKMLAKLEGGLFQNKKRIKFYKKTIADLDAKLEHLWDGKIALLRGMEVSAGLFRATWKEAQQACDVRFGIKLEREDLEAAVGLPDASEEFRHQNECADAMQRALIRGGGIVLAATASGKTAIAARIFARVTGDCLFVVDQLDLLHQQHKELEEWLGEPVGIVGESVFEPGRVTVGTIQTLNVHRKRADFKQWYRSIDMMIVDELHEQMSRRNFNVLEAIQPPAVFGLTATLRLNQRETRLKAFAFAGPVIYRFPIKVGIKREVLTKGFALQLLFRPEPLISQGMPYQAELAAQVIENENKLQTCAACVHELLLQDRHVTVLVDRVQHLKDVSDVLGDIPHRRAFGEVDVEQRQEAKLLFEEEQIRLLVANKVFKKGVNIKRIDAMLDMAEMKSKNDAVQKFGRGLRLHKAKTEFIYVDFGTDGTGRFAKAAASRRRALKEIGIDVVVVRDVRGEADAVSAIRKFIRKVTKNARQSQLNFEAAGSPS